MSKFERFVHFGVIVAAAMIIIYPTSVVLTCIMSVSGDFTLSIRDWAWAIMVGLSLGSGFVQRYLAGFVGEMVKGSALELPVAAAKFLDTVVDFVRYALAFIVTAAIVPTLATYTSAGVIWAIALTFGVAVATFSLIRPD